MASIKPYKIAVPDAKLDRLNQKLGLADFPDELDEAGWAYGAPLCVSYLCIYSRACADATLLSFRADVKRLADYWRNGFDWRKQEQKLNEMPQFQTSVSIENFEEVDMHFVHQKSEAPGAIPLLFVHGCKIGFSDIATAVGGVDNIYKGRGASLRSRNSCRY